MHTSFEFENVIKSDLKCIYNIGADGKYTMETHIKNQGHFKDSNNLPFFPSKREGKDCVISYNVHPFFMNNSLHSHSFFELMYMHHGSCKQQINSSQEIILNEGDIFLLNMQSTHEVEIASKDDIMINILISPRIFERCFSNIIYDSNFITEFVVSSLYYQRQKSPFILFKHSDYTPCIAEQIKAMVIEISQKEDCFNKILENQLAILFSYMVRAYHCAITKGKSTKSNNENNLSQILEHINENFANITLAQLAEDFHYNKSYLSSLIKKHTGNSFSTLLNEYKLKKACVLLVSSSMSMDEICETVGYYDHSHLNKVFKERYLMSPSQYRNEGNGA